MAKNSIIVVEKNVGKKIPYSVSTSKITFDDELMLNLEKYERDFINHIDICMDKFGNLVTGVIPGVAERYVAQIDIPARTYEEPYRLSGDDDDNTDVIPIPFDIKKCTLTLWALSEVINDE